MVQFRESPDLVDMIVRLDQRLRVIESMQPGRQRSLKFTASQFVIGGLTGSNNSVSGVAYSAGNIGIVCGVSVLIGSGGDITSTLTVKFPFYFANEGQNWICAGRAFSPVNGGASGLGIITPGSDTAINFRTFGTAEWGSGGTAPWDWGPNDRIDFMAVGMVDYMQGF